jgi:N-acetylglucosamine-6-phosphate deacetylase
MIDAFRFMLEHTDLSVPQVSRIASANPATQLGLQQRTGSIAIGKQADLVLTSDSFNSVQRTWVRGRQVYASD